MATSTSASLRIAFADISTDAWTASRHYLQNLFVALKSLKAEQRPNVLLLTSQRQRAAGEHPLGAYVDGLLEVPPDPAWLQRWRHICSQRVPAPFRETLLPRPRISAYLRRQRIDCVFAADEFGPKFDMPLLSWITDFQYLHLPAMFSAQEIAGRNAFLSRIARNADRVILSSESARQDFAHFAPQSAGKARILSFVAHIPPGTYDSPPSAVCEHYHLPQRFFYLPNQFWRHKNHQLVVDALALLAHRYPDITVVCTGSTNDYRDPAYFAGLLSTLSAQGVRNNLIVLGMIAHQHVFQLMRQAVAVLQPSLFEGWSTTVEEAKSLGKSILLSDIPVHRDQNPPGAVYFDPHSPEALADCLARVWLEKKPGADLVLESTAREHLAQRTHAFGQTFIAIAREIVSS